jgi:uncharacterized protein YqgV (UPF0045/DUF77 family)
MCEIAEVYQVEDCRARKEHHCIACLGVIKVGETYKRHHGVFDGSGFSDKVCPECHAMIIEINLNLNADEMIAVSELTEAVFESDAKTMNEYLAIKTKRGGEIRPWMTERVAKALKN